jgi:putative glutamine amidotransferase
MKRRPLIGISSYPKTSLGVGRGAVRDWYALPSTYVEAVRGAGGTPVIFPPGEENAERLLGLVDGLILSGGGDVAPTRYKRNGHETVYGVSEERDAFEMALAGAAIARPDRPLLCICRGLQVLNVALGGDLHVHLPDLGGSVDHRHPERLPISHPARVDPASRLGGILGTAELSVVSWHHQAVDRLGDGLKPVAWAEDGVIEGLEHERHPFCLAVQWHPEMQLEDPLQRKIFRALVERAA